MRRTRKGLAVLAGLALFATACGGDDDDGEATSATKDPNSISGQLTFWDTSDPTNEAPAFKELVAKFEQEYPNVKIDYQSVPFGEAQNKFKTAAAAKKGAPDILRAEVAWVPEFASLGYLYQLDGTELLEDESDFLEVPMSSNKYEGKTYGVPQVTDSLGLLYNKDLFAKAGVSEPPKTWDEVITISKQIEDKTGAKGISLNPGGYFLLPFIYGEGGDLLDADAKKITVNDEAAVKGVDKAVELIDSGAAAKPPASDGYAAAMRDFTTGKSAMIINGPWEVNNIRNAPDFGGEENLGIAPVPGGSQKAGAPVGGHNYVIYSGMPQEKADAATAFVKYMSSAESQAFISQELGLLPTRKSAYDLPQVKDNEIVNAFKPVVDSSVARAWIPEGGQLFAPLDQAAVEIMVNGEDTQKALDGVAKEYANVLKGWG